MAEPWIAPADLPLPGFRLGARTWRAGEPPVVAVTVNQASSAELSSEIRADALDVELGEADDPHLLGAALAHGLPVIVSTASENTASLALAHGAAGLRTPSGAHLAEVVALAVAWEASVVLVGSPATVRSDAVAAANAGLAREQIAVEVPVTSAHRARSLGWPVAVTIDEDGVSAGVAVTSAAVAAGARLLRVGDGRTARRASAVMAAVLAARGTERTP